MSFVDVKNISIHFGGLKAVDEVSFSIPKGSLYGLIGPNGAGKTTVFNILSGFYCADHGKVVFDNTDITNKKADETNLAGIARTFQNIRLFKNLSVLENVVIACQQKEMRKFKNPWLHSIFNTKKYQQFEKQLKTEALELLKIFKLDTQAYEKASSLPYGSQRKLEIVRALATKPKLLMLDEPAAGMNPVEKNELNQLIRFIKEKFNLTILLIEHDMKVVMPLCDRITVLHQGKKIAEGTSAEIKNSEVVIEAYLGKRHV